MRESLSAADPNNVDLRVDMAESHRSIANILAAAVSDLNTGELHARQGLAIAEGLMPAQNTSTRALRVLTETQDALGRMLLLKGETDSALTMVLESLKTAERLLAIDPKNMQARQDLASGHTMAGNTLTKKGDFVNAIRHHREALAMNEAMVADDPTNQAAKRWIAQNYMNLATALEAGEREAAIRSYQQAVSISEALAKEKPGDIQTTQFGARAYEKLGEAFLRQKELPAALENLRHAVELTGQALERDPKNDIMRRLRAVTYFDVGEVRWRFGTQRRATENERNEQLREARKAYQQSLELFLELRGRGTLTKEFSDKPDQVPAKIAACDAALANRETHSTRPFH